MLCSKTKSNLRKIPTFVNVVLNRSIGITVVRDPARRMARSGKTIFKNRRLDYSSNGYWFVDPMPNFDDLSTYYTKYYWQSRGGSNIEVRARDLVHVQMICDLDPFLLSQRSLRILNFGAGNGGASYLFHAMGHDVINVEPSGLPDHFSERWTSVPGISEVPNSSIDLIYTSHALEHVSDISQLFGEFLRISDSSTRIFIEVPNALHPENGAQLGAIDIPHTYYFAPTFFENWFEEVLILSGFSHPIRNSAIQNWRASQNSAGEVIRAFGTLQVSEQSWITRH